MRPGFPSRCGNISAHCRDTFDVVGIRVGDQPITADKSDIRKYSLQLRVPSSNVVVQNPNTVPSSQSFQLRHNAAALIPAHHNITEDGCVIQCAAVNEVMNVSYKQMRGQIFLCSDRSIS